MTTASQKADAGLHRTAHQFLFMLVHRAGCACLSVRRLLHLLLEADGVVDLRFAEGVSKAECKQARDGPGQHASHEQSFDHDRLRSVSDRES